MKEIDKDRSGKIDKKEAQQGGITPQQFAAADTDHDGLIDKEEFEAARRTYTPENDLFLSHYDLFWDPGGGSCASQSSSCLL